MENYIRPEERLYQVVMDKEQLDWKGFLYGLIEQENLDPWDIDLSVLTKTYISEIKRIKYIDFETSGKLLVVAVFLLKTKVETLLNKDIRGIEDKISAIQNSNDNIDNELDELDGLNDELDNIETYETKKSYKLNYRNPIARKRKVSIFDLVKVLEKTLETSQRRKENILMRKQNSEYEGPKYHESKRNLKELVEDIFQTIIGEIESKKSHVLFSNIIHGKNKLEVIETFLPILHLSNHNRINLKQNSNFDEIYITKSEK